MTGLWRDVSSRPGLPARSVAKAVGGLVALSWLSFGSGEASPAERPRDVVLVTIDTLRADATGFGGRSPSPTPNLDRVAERGRVWTDVHAHSVTTLPSHASMFTGLYPFEHGARENGGFELDPSVATVAEAMRAAGFSTAAFVGAYPLDAAFGLDRGFDVYDDDYAVGSGDQIFRYSERPAGEVVDRAVRWWTDHGAARRFLWIHLYDVHAPYEPPYPFDERYAADPYLGEVAAVDAALASLLDRITLGGTLLVVTSDHGEALGEHGEETHGLFAYESTLAVPLLVSGPGVAAGRDDRPARLVDIGPTLLDAAEVEPLVDVEGVSLLASLPGDREPVSYFEALTPFLDYGWAPIRGVVADGMKLIELPIPELYDLSADPDESENLVTTQRQRARELARRIPEEQGWPPTRGELTAESTARLQSLGYLAGGSSRVISWGPEDDPKTLVHLDEKMTALPNLVAAGRLSEAEEVARAVVAERPSMTLAQLYLGRILMEQGKLEQAVAVLEAARVEGASGRALEVQLGRGLIRLGRPAEGLAVLEPIAAIAFDTEVEAVRALGLAATGRLDEARKALETVIERQPLSAESFETLSFLELQAERYSPARDAAMRALELDDRRSNAWNNLGVALYWLGEPERALVAWRRSVALAPDSPDALLSLGLVAAESGLKAEAKGALQSYLATAPGANDEAGRRQAREVLRQLG